MMLMGGALSQVHPADSMARPEKTDRAPQRS
jgi:hypothetical protein